MHRRCGFGCSAAGFLACALAAGVARGQEGPPVTAIQDNSFLVEEAYNQEEGVVQHIFTFQRSRGGVWYGTLTQEWPAPGQKHQLSYTVPYARVAGDATSSSGVGDIALNYRYQLAGSGDTRFACAPRVSVLLPTGDSRRELGSGGVGLQANVAASTVLSDRLVAHSNLGGTYFPAARNAAGDEAVVWGANAAQSLIWAVHRNFNALVEAVWIYAQTVTGPGATRESNTFVVSPGIRWAHNFSGLQIVPGVAVPISVGPGHRERSVFVYLSLEHPMWSPRKP